MKKFFALLLVFTLLLSGCANGAPKEIVTLAKIYENTSKAEQIKVSYDGKMQILFSNDDIYSNQAIFKDMFNNIVIQGESRLDQTNGKVKMSANYSVDINDLIMNFSMYADDTQFAIKYPLIGKYVVGQMVNSLSTYVNSLGLKDEDTKKITAFIEDAQKTITPMMIKAIIDKFEPSHLQTVDQYVFTLNEKQITKKAIVLNIDENLFYSILYGLIDDVVASEEMYNLATKHFSEIDVDNYDAYVDYIYMQKEKYQSGFYHSDVLSLLNHFNLKMAFSYDEQHRASIVDTRYSFEYMPFSYHSDNKTSLFYQITTKYSYEPVEIIKPNLTPENTIDLFNMY